MKRTLEELELQVEKMEELIVDFMLTFKRDMKEVDQTLALINDRLNKLEKGVKRVK